jgi:hypothetical protein
MRQGITGWDMEAANLQLRPTRVGLWLRGEKGSQRLRPGARAAASLQALGHEPMVTGDEPHPPVKLVAIATRAKHGRPYDRATHVP